MFGKKKSKDQADSQPVASKSEEKGSAKSKSKSKGSFDAKEFMLYHVEKFVFGLMLLLSAGLVYLGFTSKTIEATKDPKSFPIKPIRFSIRYGRTIGMRSRMKRRASRE